MQYFARTEKKLLSSSSDFDNIGGYLTISYFIIGSSIFNSVFKTLYTANRPFLFF